MGVSSCAIHCPNPYVGGFTVSHPARVIAVEVRFSVFVLMIKPKQATCLQSRHNLELAQGQYPVAAVYGESPSFTAAVDLVMACVELITRLKPSWAQPSG